MTLSLRHWTKQSWSQLISASVAPGNSMFSFILILGIWSEILNLNTLSLHTKENIKCYLFIGPENYISVTSSSWGFFLRQTKHRSYLDQTNKWKHANERILDTGWDKSQQISQHWCHTYIWDEWIRTRKIIDNKRVLIKSLLHFNTKVWNITKTRAYWSARRGVKDCPLRKTTGSFDIDQQRIQSKFPNWSQWYPILLECAIPAQYSLLL